MNEELKNELLKLFKDGKDFVITQTPDVIQQYIGAQFISAAMGAVFFGLISMVLIKFIVWCVGQFKAGEFDVEASPLMMFPIGGAILFVVLFYCNAEDAMKIKFYPKGYLLEQVMKKK